ncbi:uncharacterized protein ColSpa_02209 [Colletotrichum spaethianum]|uniref:Uncharacterized protein n=1 Tax=Colletotrichum spaethianum TaxID=700344 RepID=A0AA37L522_9PEZI|nr:uncharacterized protein ColSpa_02209 [Colletotrichum spaethianum]GKT42028.1 hypothetical protein ColSpa_02209 [Colletotrichum spaethianum]
MPSVAEEHPRLMAPGKKRRRDVNDSNNDLQIQGPLYEKLAQYHSAAAAATNNWNADGVFGSRPVQQQIQQQQQQNFFPRFPGSNNDRMIFQYGFPAVTNTTTEDSRQNHESESRKIAPLPVSKRQRMFDEEDADLDSLDGGLSTQPNSQRQRRHSKSPPASQHNSPVLPVQTDAVGNRPKTPSSLSPCHICHRRPTKKSDLDSFADCQGCGLRSCFVCIRECQGWQKDGRPSSGGGDLGNVEQAPEQGGINLSRSCQMDDVDDDRQRQSREDEESKRKGQPKRKDGWAGGGHRQMVCSRCCIEKGAEGDVVCLGCLSRMESV